MIEATNNITVDELMQQHGDRLELTCVAGKIGKKRIILPEKGLLGNEVEGEKGRSTEKSLVGYLNLIHPHQIQVIGGAELKYIDGLRDITRHDAIKQLFKHEPAYIP
jgi:HPr kinase/phosphorylase